MSAEKLIERGMWLAGCGAVVVGVALLGEGLGYWGWW